MELRSLIFAWKLTRLLKRVLLLSTTRERFKRVPTLRGGDICLSSGIGFPTCISVNNCICHFSPLPSDPEASATLKDGDLVKVELGAQIDGFAAIVGDSFVVGASKDKPVTGRKADVLQAAHLASEAALRLVKPGGKNWDVTDTVHKVAQAFSCKPVESGS